MHHTVKPPALSTALVPFAISLLTSGRPFPLKGKSYANVFIHFEPAGHCSRHSARMTGEEVAGDAEAMYRTAKQKSAPEVDEMEVLPFHITPGSVEAKRWMQELYYPVFKNKIEVRSNTCLFQSIVHSLLISCSANYFLFYHQLNSKGDLRTKLRANGAHNAASNGDLDMFKAVLIKHPEWLNSADQNGWQPIHEAARGGHLDVVAFLIEKGANLNSRTNKGKGGTALWWAELSHGKNHPVSKKLQTAGALKLGPGE